MRHLHSQSTRRALIIVVLITGQARVCFSGEGQFVNLRESLDSEVVRLDESANEPVTRDYFVQAGVIARAIAAGSDQGNLNTVATKLFSNLMGKKLDPLEVGAADIPAKVLLARFLIGNERASDDERRTDLLLLSQFLGAVRAEWQPNFIPKLVVANVAPPGGVAGMAGMSPDAISDPVMRAQYEAAIRENGLNGALNSRQASLEGVQKELSRPIVEFIIRTARSDVKARELVPKCIIDARLTDSEQAEIERALD